jgi:cell division transport system permease protein
MSSSFESYQKRRLKSSYFSVVISIALVLFMIGVLGMLLLKSNKIAAHFKEKVAVTVFLKDQVTPSQTKKLEALLTSKKYTKTTRFLSKEKAAEIYSQDIGEDFLEFLGKNPLKNSIDIFLKADFVAPLKMVDIKNELLENTYVTEVVYDEPLIQLLTQNIQKISFWIVVVAAFFALVAVLLINSSIRLSVHSKRFTIKTMQMVGATKRFIRTPFVWKGIRLGLAGAFLASVGLGFLFYYSDQYFPELKLWANKKELLLVFTGVFVAGFVITWLSTFFATQRFLNLKTDQLYYS